MACFIRTRRYVLEEQLAKGAQGDHDRGHRALNMHQESRPDFARYPIDTGSDAAHDIDAHHDGAKTENGADECLLAD